MTDYTNLIDKVNIPELVKALRHCISDPYGFVECDGCPIFCKGIDCQNNLHNDAAAAIEGLQAQLPKRGKWIYKPKDAIEMMFTLPKCSVCGHESSDANNYCPNCWAKMEVQE